MMTIDSFFNPMKVMPLEKHKEKKKVTYAQNYMVSEKIDGIYLSIYYDGEEFHYPRTANGKYPYAVRPFTDSLNFDKEEVLNKLNITDGASFFLIGEADIQGEPSFHVKSGKFNKKEEYAENAVFLVHDMVYVANTGRNIFYDTRTAHARYIKIPKVLTDSVKKLPLIGMFSSIDEIESVAKLLIAKGKEGVIMKDSGSIYEPGKRIASLMKIKSIMDFDLLCIHYFMSVGKKGNECWNMELSDKTGVVVTVRVGKETDVEYFSTNSPIGKVVTIECMGKTNLGSYREPRFVRIRDDKSPSDID